MPRFCRGSCLTNRRNQKTRPKGEDEDEDEDDDDEDDDEGAKKYFKLAENLVC